MSRTSSIYLHVNTYIENETYDSRLEVNPSSENHLLTYASLTKDQFNAEIQKGINDIRNGRVYNAKDVEQELLH